MQLSHATLDQLLFFSLYSSCYKKVDSSTLNFPVEVLDFVDYKQKASL